MQGEIQSKSGNIAADPLETRAAVIIPFPQTILVRSVDIEIWSECHPSAEREYRRPYLSIPVRLVLARGSACQPHDPCSQS